MSSFSDFNDSGCTTDRSGVLRLFFCQNKHFLNLEVPDTDLAMDWLIQHPTDKYTPKVQGIHSFMLEFFSVTSMRIFCALRCQSPSLSELISGVT